MSYGSSLAYLYHQDGIYTGAFSKANSRPTCRCKSQKIEMVTNLKTPRRSASPATHRRRLDRELDRLLDLKPTEVEGSHLRATIAVTARDKPLVFLTRRDVEATNNESERALARIEGQQYDSWAGRLRSTLMNARGLIERRPNLQPIRSSGAHCRLHLADRQGNLGGQHQGAVRSTRSMARSHNVVLRVNEYVAALHHLFWPHVGVGHNLPVSQPSREPAIGAPMSAQPVRLEGDVSIRM